MDGDGLVPGTQGKRKAAGCGVLSFPGLPVSCVSQGRLRTILRLALAGWFSIMASGALSAAPGAQWTVIDRVAAVAGYDAITLSQIDRENRLAAFVNHAKPDFSAASKRQAADRLIDQALVRQDMESSRYPAPPAGSEAEMLDRIKKGYGSNAAFQAKLEEYGISEDDLKAFLLWELTFVQFTDVRFRPGVQIQPAEIRAYFDKEVLPKLKGANAEEEFAKRRQEIEEKLLGDRVNQALNDWLKETRSRTKIEFRKEAFE
jgi:hypothetical protein